MALINLQNVSIDFPVFNSTVESLKKRLMYLATGGQLNETAVGVVVIRALDNLRFTILDGERVDLLGHNGAGKTTLLRVTSSADAPTNVNAYIQGKLGALIDTPPGIDSEASGLENIYFLGRLLGMTGSKIKAKIQKIVEYSELGDFNEMPVRTFSIICTCDWLLRSPRHCAPSSC